jgi:hypothetical protein
MSNERSVRIAECVDGPFEGFVTTVPLGESCIDIRDVDGLRPAEPYVLDTGASGEPILRWNPDRRGST